MYRPYSEIKEAQAAVKTIEPKDDRQREILANMYYAACNLIGGLENILSDYDEADEEYIGAQDELNDRETLIGDVEAMCLSGYYGCGMEGPQRPYQKHYTFAGNAFIHRCAEAVVTSMGY